MALAALRLLAPTPAAAQQVEPIPEARPLVVLHHTEGNFFVLASDIPFSVRKANAQVQWLSVESVEDLETAHRTISVNGNPEGLPRGTHFAAIRIDLTTAEPDDYVLLPVALRVGEELEGRFGRDPELEGQVPAAYLRLEPKDPNIGVDVKFTPGGHFILEIFDKVRREEELQSLPVSLLKPDVVEPLATTTTYPIVFPWMCLEVPCGRATADDIADVAPNVDAVTAISYERYSMSWGNWSILSVGNPGPWAQDAGLETWPMVVGGYQPSAAAVQAMWNGRVTIANNMIAAAINNGYRGYCIDVEGHADTATKNTFINLLNFLAGELHANGFEIMVAHATWSTIAPIADLAASSVDYVATMDPYTGAWQTYIPQDYGAIEPERLIWAFTWDNVAGSTQTTMWQWMEASGYNVGVAGAAAWRTPLMPPHPGNSIDYYDGFRTYYPAGGSPEDCIETVGTDRWKGEYFNNKTLSGNPVMVRDDGTGFLNFDWGSGSPGSSCGVGADNFSVRWTRTPYFNAGTYEFNVTSDDGFRLYVDGVLRMEAWFDQGPTDYTVNVSLSAGYHTIRLDYYENGGGAVASLDWALVSNCFTTVPSTSWKGEYFTNKTLSGSPAMVRNDGTGFLNFPWYNDSPSPACAFPADNFSVRWTRTVYFNAGTYQFNITSDDGFRLYIDGALKIQAWFDQGPTDYTAVVSLSAGYHTIQMDYYENGGWAVAKLDWELLSGCFTSVPSTSWKGEYFTNKTLSGSPAMVRNDGAGFLDFPWYSDSPSPACGFPADNFSVRWIRNVYFTAGTYQFTITSDDGFKFYVDGVLRRQAWFDQGPTTYTANVYLTAGYHTLRMDYYENGGWAVAKLSWKKGQPVLRQVIWRGGVAYLRLVPFQANGTAPNWGQAGDWSSFSASSLPGAGTVQAWNMYAMQSGLIEAFWRDNQGYYRTVPWGLDGHPNYAAAPAWSGPLPLSSLPGTGNIQAANSFRVGTVFWQSFWRGNQGWYRTVPVTSSGEPIWNQANAWQGPLSLSGLPGLGSIQAQSGVVYAGEQELLQSFWRSNQGYWRIVPIDSTGKILWTQAQPWSAPIPVSALPGAFSIHAQAGEVYAEFP